MSYREDVATIAVKSRDLMTELDAMRIENAEARAAVLAALCHFEEAVNLLDKLQSR